MTTPRGPEMPHSPSPPQPPRPETVPTYPQPIHPGHSLPAEAILAPPDGTDQPPPPLALRRPSILGPTRQAGITPEPTPKPNEPATEQRIGLEALRHTAVGYEPLQPHPGRIENPEELATAREAGMPVTEILLVDHIPENAARIAAAARGCGILALEGTGQYRSETEMHTIERMMTSALSSDPEVHESARKQIDGFTFADPFVKPLLAEMYGSDAKIALADITTFDPGHAQIIRRMAAASEAWNKMNKHPNTSSADISKMLVGWTENYAVSGPIRDINFAERLDALRQAHPDEDIRLVVGAGHYKIADELDESHPHALTVCTPLTASDYTDDMLHMMQRGEPIPESLIERATLSFMYVSIAERAQGKIAHPNQLGTHPSYHAENKPTTPWVKARVFLIDNMTDEQVRETVAKLDRTIGTLMPPFDRFIGIRKRLEILTDIIETYGR